MVLTDLLVTNDQLDVLDAKLREHKGNIGAVVAVATYRDVQCAASKRQISYVQLDYSAEPENCRFCLQDSIPLTVKNLPEVQEKLGKFDAVVFWELVRSDPSFYRVGHESIPRTGYHYHFRIFAKPLFQRHSYGLAVRIRNAARSTGVFPEWVGKIVCANDPELRSFAADVAEVFGLSDKDVVALPRGDFRQVAGKRIDKPLRDRLRDAGGKALARQNVLIVDQAAHHFKTVAALASVCAEFDSKVLGFAVVVGRVPPEVRLSGHLPFSHYVPLYVWPCAPALPHECACQRSGNV